MRLIKWLLAIAIVAAAAPFVALAGYGFAHGLDVGNAFRMLFATPSGETVDADLVPYHKPVAVRWLGNVDNLDLSESSGLATSVAAEGVLWSINDSGNDSEVFALGVAGEDLGAWAVDIPQAGDWEALSSFQLDGDAYLMIADVGDNFRWRPTLRLIVVREPALDDPQDAPVKIAWSFEYRYPEGYRDCEALAVDETNEEVLLISKRVIPAEVYRLPLRPTESLVMAKKIAVLDKLPQPVERDLFENARYGRTRSQPTGFDIAGRRAIVATYKDAYLYERQPGEQWEAAFSRIPKRIALPMVPSRESVALARDGSRFYTTNERSRGTDAAGIFEVEL